MSNLRDYFAFNPWLFYLSSNITLILLSIPLGFGLMMLININTTKFYGVHCNYDSDCATDMNYLCQDGICNCSFTTYYESASLGCSNIDNVHKFYNNYVK